MQSAHKNVWKSKRVSSRDIIAEDFRHGNGGPLGHPSHGGDLAKHLCFGMSIFVSVSISIAVLIALFIAFSVALCIRQLDPSDPERPVRERQFNCGIEYSSSSTGEVSSTSQVA